MNGKLTHTLTDGAETRRSDLGRAVLSVQRERVALTESFARLALDHGPLAVEALMVRLLRLQRAVAMAEGAKQEFQYGRV